MDLLSLPKVIGRDEAGNDLLIGIGRFGPYIKIGSKFVSIKGDDPYAITLERALELVKEHQDKEALKNIKEFAGSTVRVLNGRYGPYITDGEKNAKIPKEARPEDLTLEECQELLAKAPEKKRRGGFKRKS